MEKQLATRPRYPQQPTEPVDIEREKENFLTFSEKQAFYKAGFNRAPTARMVREWAKDEGLSFEIVEFGKDKDHAWAKVRVWKGEKNAPIAEADGGCVHVFAHLLAESALDAIANGLKIPTGKNDQYGRPEMRDYYLTPEDWTINPETNFPVITHQIVQFQLMRNHLGKIKTIERDAITKAERAAEIKLLTKLGKISENLSEPPPKENGGETLDNLRQQIREKLLILAGNDRPKALAKLTEISAGDGLPGVTSLTAIQSIEQAQKILKRLEEERNEALRKNS